MASGVLAYDISLKAGRFRDIWLAVPLHPDSEVAGAESTPDAAVGEVARLERKTTQYWRGRLSLMPWSVPDRAWEETLRANLGYLMIHRDGDAIQAGSRAYEASWIRDAAQSATVLLQVGLRNQVEDYLKWYAGYQFADGRVPAIVIASRRETNPVHEYDSQGQWIYLVNNYLRYGGDPVTVSNLWPTVFKSGKYLETLRKNEEKEFYLSRPDERRYYGILPRSVSHEGYYPEPGNHSYWDNFWALRGWRDAQLLADRLGLSI
jgi:glycogen debranching enzyme